MSCPCSSTAAEPAYGPTFYVPAGQSARFVFEVLAGPNAPGLDLADYTPTLLAKTAITVADADASLTAEIDDGLVWLDQSLGLLAWDIAPGDFSPAAYTPGSPWVYVLKLSKNAGAVVYYPVGGTGELVLDAVVPACGGNGQQVAYAPSARARAVGPDDSPIPVFATTAYVTAAVDAEAATRAAADTANSNALSTHTARTDNPHAVTKAQVGLGNVDNTSDANKPVSTAQAASIALKLNNAEISSGALACASSQRQSITSSTWTTLFERSGAGTMESLWLAFDQLGGSGAMFTAKIRITFDAAATPQVGGTSGIAVQDFFGGGLGAHVLFRSNRISVNKSTSAGWSGDCNIPMPFGSSIKIEVYLVNSVPSWAWCMPEIGPVRRVIGGLLPSDGWYFKAEQVDTTLASLASGNLINTATATRVLGVNIQFQPGSGGQNFYYLEGDFKGYADGSGSPSYQSSGAEDFFLGSYYFEKGLYVTDRAALLYKDLANGTLAAFRFFNIEAMPGGGSSYRLSWTNGDADYLAFIPAYSTRIIAVTYYYGK